MSLDEAIAAVRFGYGLSPVHGPPLAPGSRVADLMGADAMAARYPIPGFAIYDDLTPEYRKRAKARNDQDPVRQEAAKAAYRDFVRGMMQDSQRVLAATVARCLDAPDPLRERLVRFWADHFTVIGKTGLLRWAPAHYVEDAIRPHVAGRFADLLRAAILHPAMLLYLDQARSVGPNSTMAARNEGRGLNENLARELLELHTLGVGGGYRQADVRQLAELLAGLTAGPVNGWQFNPRRGEPGPETILGRSYGRERPRVEDVYQVLDDLARHPDTARHLARKLAVHFVADTPDPGLVDALAAEFVARDGDLASVYRVLLEHPAARAPELTKAKRPFDFLVSALRALGVRGAQVAELPPALIHRYLRRPLERMAQPWLQPSGPDGWAEDAAHWITPQGLAGRVTWAMDLRRVEGLDLPDPREFVDVALGPLASERVRFAAEAAETRADGVGVILASPDFNRR